MSRHFLLVNKLITLPLICVKWGSQVGNIAHLCLKLETANLPDTPELINSWAISHIIQVLVVLQWCCPIFSLSTLSCILILSATYPCQLRIRIFTKNKIFAADKLHDMPVFIIMIYRAALLTNGQCVKEFSVFLGREYTISDLLNNN